MNKIRNLKIMPTSKLIFYSQNADQCEFSESELDRILTTRLVRGYRLNSEKAYYLIERDKKIMSRYGADIREYKFESASDDLIGEYQKFCWKGYSDLTFSELCIFSHVMNMLGDMYNSYNDTFKREWKEKNSVVIGKPTSVLHRDDIKSSASERNIAEQNIKNYDKHANKYWTKSIDLKRDILHEFFDISVSPYCYWMDEYSVWRLAPPHDRRYTRFKNKVVLNTESKAYVKSITLENSKKIFNARMKNNGHMKWLSFTYDN